MQHVASFHFNQYTDTRFVKGETYLGKKKKQAKQADEYMPYIVQAYASPETSPITDSVYLIAII